jgi:hypothetical protein
VGGFVPSTPGARNFASRFTNLRPSARDCVQVLLLSDYATKSWPGWFHSRWSGSGCAKADKSGLEGARLALLKADPIANADATVLPIGH